MRLATLACLLLLVAGCDTSDPAPTDPATITLTAEGRVLVDQTNAFGARLFAETAGDRDENLMLSPLSASIALTMLLNGADGDTYTQIRDLLGATDSDLDAINASAQSLQAQLLAADPQVELGLANAVFYRDTFAPAIQPSFLETMRGPFDAEVRGLDFDGPGALDVINGWASDRTNGRIETVLTELSPSLVMLLMNALTFKGDWTTPFDEAVTDDRDFALSDGTVVSTPTMRGDVEARRALGTGYQAVEMPYGRRNFSMVVMRPDEALPDFVSGLAAGRWAEVTDALDADDRWETVTVQMPRFTFANDEPLNAPLQALGMVDAFTRRADLTGIAPGLVVSFVKQNTFVEVNEEGTEAAAVTTIGIDRTSAPSYPIFQADRPFVFAIRERTTNTLLFLGQVTDPRA